MREITIDVADTDDGALVKAQTARRSVVRNSSVTSGKQTLDVDYGVDNRYTRVAAFTCVFSRICVCNTVLLLLKFYLIF